jgi:hypothetical protein
VRDGRTATGTGCAAADASWGLIIVSDRRIVVAGVPKSGKTTFVETILQSDLGSALMGLGRPTLTVHHSDDLIDLDWSSQSLAAMRWLDEPGPWICEGVTMIRALRKWTAVDTNWILRKPCDTLYWFGTHATDVTRRQRALGNNCQGIFDEVAPYLISSGVQINLR